MPARTARIRIRSTERESAVDITERVNEAVRGSRVPSGVCVVASAHTTAGILINENADPDVIRDLLRRLALIVPVDEEDRHAEGNTPAHVKAILVGASVTVPVKDGALDLGRWQGIFLADFDGPRDRTATVTVIGEVGA
ncbi:MAG TPA: secondary thiamine-phosphate synthase enzyme YjbQ [Candidatus Limnocylindria bacterium]|nr:secondary thiamine-phosphate synthase enzyme YjbQ [Candidatus Limnocylindria bacterium]